MRVSIWPLTMIWAALSPAAHAASFDCSRASTKVERMICDTPKLSRLDDIMGKTYAAVINGGHRSPASIEAMGSEEIAKEQRAWLGKRDKCASRECLMSAYRERLPILACPAVFGSEEALHCTDAQLELAKEDLVEAEAARDQRLAEGSDRPDWVVGYARAEADAWRKYMQARCSLYGELNGGAYLWKPAQALACELNETKARIAELATSQ